MKNAKLQNDYCKYLNCCLKKLKNQYSSDVISLSGGLDSSTLLSVYRPRYAITITRKDFNDDIVFARKVCEKFKVKHIPVILTSEEILDSAIQIVKLFRTFDPIQIRNNLVIFFAIKKAKEMKFTSIITGDGGDELFAGYNYLKKYYNNKTKLKKELGRLQKIMDFASIKIGKFFEIDVISPLASKEMVDLTKKIPIEELVGEEDGKVWGKLILRKCFEKNIGKDIAWREKKAQEIGSGFTSIGDYISEQIITDVFFEDEKIKYRKEGVVIRNKEHLFYYSLYRKLYSSPTEQYCKDKRCPECGGCFIDTGKYCKICGGFPVVPVSK